MSIQTKLERQLLNNTLIYMRSESMTGNIVRSAAEVASVKTPANIFKCPVNKLTFKAGKLSV
jgi:hypothetical protein